jgi:hypothetical protein
MPLHLPDPLVIDAEGQLKGWSVQRDLEALAGSLRGMFGGRDASIRFSSGTLTFPGGSSFTNTLTLAHGLGKTPIAALATATLAGGTVPVTVSVVAVDATNVQWRGYADDGSSPALNTTKLFYWLVIG